jgi:hypothetical protein
MPDSQRDELIDMIDELETVGDVRALARLLTPET